MRDRDRPAAAFGQVAADQTHDVLDRRVLRAQLGARPEVPHEGGLEERDAVEMHGAVLVVDRDRRAGGQRIGHDVDAVAQQRGLESEPRRGVVVSARHDDLRAGVGQGAQGVAQKRVTRGRGGCGVEDVSRDDHDIDVVLTHLSGERVEHTAQRIERGVAVERPPDVPVRGVQDAHVHTVRAPCDIAAEAGGRFAHRGRRRVSPGTRGRRAQLLRDFFLRRELRSTIEMRNATAMKIATAVMP